MFGRKGVKPPEARSEAAESPFARELAAILAASEGLHPLDLAARVTGLMSATEYNDDHIEFVRVRDIAHPTVCDLSHADPDAVGVSFSLYGEHGEKGLIYLTTAFGQIHCSGASPGARVSAEMIARFVPNYNHAVRNLVAQRTPQKPQEVAEQEQRIRSSLREFLG